MLTIHVLLLASVQIGISVLLCLYWFKGSVSDVMVVLHIHMHTYEKPSLTGIPPCFVTPRTLINISAPALLC